MFNINDVPMVMVLLLWDLAYGRTDGWTYVRTDSHLTTKLFEIDGLPNFLRYAAPLACLRCAGAPLLRSKIDSCLILNKTSKSKS